MELVSNLVVRDRRTTSICFSHTHFHIFTCKKRKLYPCKAAQAYAFTVSGCCSQLTSERKIFFTALLNRNFLYAIVYPKDCTTVLNQLLLPRMILRLSLSCQVKPVHPLCGTTKPGAIFMQTRRQSPPSWPRTLSMQSNPMPKLS